MRTAFISILTFFILAVPSGIAFAQIPQCNPACDSNHTCVAIGDSGTQTECVPAAQNGEVDAITVTAAPKSSSGTLLSIVNGTIIPLGNQIVGLLFAVAFLFFIFGVFQYFFAKGGDAKARADGRGFILWSIIGLTVLFSVWGLVHLVIGILPGS